MQPWKEKGVNREVLIPRKKVWIVELAKITIMLVMLDIYRQCLQYDGYWWLQPKDKIREKFKKL